MNTKPENNNEQKEDSESFSETKTNNENQTNIEKKSIKKGEIRSFELKYLENLAVEEDTLTEIKYVNDPKDFSEISNRIKALIITIHEENAAFAEEISLDYFFVNGEEEFIKIMDPNYINFLFESLSYDFIIFDIDSRKVLLEAFERSFLDKEERDSHYFIFYPFCKASTILQDEKKIIKPKQTWQYLNGDLNPEFLNLDKLEVLFSIFYESEGRTDKINSFEGILKENKWKYAGNNITNARLLFREVAFRIGKLPKFGA